MDQLIEQVPLVSVLVPVYNSAAYLPHCLESIIGQTYRNLQIVIVDDASSDNGFSICTHYASIDSRIELVQIEHSGVSEARNQLLKHAKGKYSIFIDSDDYYSDNSVIEKIVRYNVDYSLDVSIFDINGNGPATLREILTKKEALGVFLKDSIISSSVCAKLVKTDIYHKLHFDSEVECGEDLLMTWSILNNSEHVGLLNGKFYNYRNNLNSITNGGYNYKTFTLHKVWDKIIEDCTTLLPGLLKYAKVKQIDCYERLLLSAVNSNVDINNDSRIQNLRSFLKKNVHIVLSKRRSPIWCIAVISCVYMFDTVRLVARLCDFQLNLIR